MADELFNRLRTMKDWKEFQKDLKDYRPMPGSILPCALCSAPFMMLPYSGTPDPVCPACMKEHRESARIECVGCKVVVARVYPETLESGYEIKKKAILHTNKCGFCSPGLAESTVIEIDMWEKHVGYKRKTTIPLYIPGNG